MYSPLPNGECGRSQFQIGSTSAPKPRLLSEYGEFAAPRVAYYRRAFHSRKPQRIKGYGMRCGCGKLHWTRGPAALNATEGEQQEELLGDSFGSILAELSKSAV